MCTRQPAPAPAPRRARQQPQAQRATAGDHPGPAAARRRGQRGSTRGRWLRAGRPCAVSMARLMSFDRGRGLPRSGPGGPTPQAARWWPVPSTITQWACGGLHGRPPNRLLASRYPGMAARRAPVRVLAVTTWGRPEATLDGRGRDHPEPQKGGACRRNGSPSRAGRPAQADADGRSRRSPWISATPTSSGPSGCSAERGGRPAPRPADHGPAGPAAHGPADQPVRRCGWPRRGENRRLLRILPQQLINCFTVRAGQLILKHMPNHPGTLDQVFQALADTTRRSLVERLIRGPASVSELAQPLAISLPAVMQHLGVLEACRLVRSEKAGRVRTCRIDPEGLRLAENWIAAQRTAWEQHLDQLGEVLAEQPAAPGPPPRRSTP